MREIKNMLITILLSITMALGGLPLGIFAEGEDEGEINTPIEENNNEVTPSEPSTPNDQSEPSVPSEPTTPESTVPSEPLTPEEPTSDDENKNEAVEPKEEETPQAQVKEYNLTIHYKDINSDDEIASSKILQFEANDNYDITEYLNVKGYTFKEASKSITGTMPEDNISITLLYESNKKETYTLTINYYELNKTTPLKESTVKKDLEGDFDYSETISRHINNTVIEGYVYDSCSKDTSGTMNNKNVEINLYYKPEKKSKHKITIKFTDSETKKSIREPLVKEIEEGENYDLTKEYNKIIDELWNNYDYSTTDKPQLKGIMAKEDIELEVILVKNSKTQITIAYIDKDTKEEIAHCMVDYPDENGNYDVTKYNARKIDGYKYIKTVGNLKGNLPVGSENITIKVYYEKIVAKHSIIINYLNYDTGEILSPQTIVKDIKENQKYDLYNIFEVTHTKLLKQGYTLIEPQILRGRMGTEDIVIDAYYIVEQEVISSKVYVNYLELGTNKVIHKQFVSKDIQQGDIYDVTNQDAISIGGYRYVKTDGDTCNFMTDHDVTINVYYNKAPNQYRVTINYLNMDGKTIKSSVTTNLMDENSTYDISKYNAVKIAGYKYVKTTGDSISGILTSNKVINVYYEKLSFAESVKTGDYTNLYLWIGVCIVAIIVLAFLIKKYRK